MANMGLLVRPGFGGQLCCHHPAEPWPDMGADGSAEKLWAPGELTLSRSPSW